MNSKDVEYQPWNATANQSCFFCSKSDDASGVFIAGGNSRICLSDCCDVGCSWDLYGGCVAAPVIKYRCFVCVAKTGAVFWGQFLRYQYRAINRISLVFNAGLYWYYFYRSYSVREIQVLLQNFLPLRFFRVFVAWCLWRFCKCTEIASY